MRCSTVRSTGTENECTGTATHLMLYSIREDEGGRQHFRDPVCEPCVRAFERRPVYRARIVPLHIVTPAPKFKDAVEGHRLIDHPMDDSQCYDCGRTGTVAQFRFTLLHGCPARPESVDHLRLTGAATKLDTNGRAKASARKWFHEAAHVLGMGIEDWREVLDDDTTCATFTFRDREYRLMFDLGFYRMTAQKLENRGQPAPETINPDYRESYKQVVFHFHSMVNRYEAEYFAAYTLDCEDVILYAPEGQICAVLRLPDLAGTRAERLALVTDAVCDTFGAIADRTFKDHIYG
ncbi:hypothetical protein ACH4Y0_02780 [Streptomyces sp. NPDC020707]|uniref:hypothetical protein n=1 Tax=Streptomyces sp. NPDC020707 TaxID=3365084 RepID=UPI00379ADE5A